MSGRALVGNAADEEQVKDALRRERRGQSQSLGDWAHVLSTRPGRRFFWALLEHCAPLESPISHDPNHTYRNIGRGDVGRYLIAQMEEADPDAWDRMRKEAKEDQNGR